MKTKLILMSTIRFLSASPHRYSTTPESWSITKERNGIQIYTRWIRRITDPFVASLLISTLEELRDQASKIQIQ